MSTPGPQEPTAAPKPLSKRQQAKNDRRQAFLDTSIWSALRPSRASGALIWMLVALAVLWLLVGVNALADHRLTQWGIVPRTPKGAIGIALSPFIHVDAGHMASDTVPFAVIGWVVLTSGFWRFLLVTLMVMLFSGGITWLAGPSHQLILGSAGVIFGWMGYVLARAWFSRNIKWIAIAVIVVAVFAGTFAGLLPNADQHTFWGGNVAGGIVGILVAAALYRRKKPEEAALPKVGHPSPSDHSSPSGPLSPPPAGA